MPGSVPGSGADRWAAQGRRVVVHDQPDLGFGEPGQIVHERPRIGESLGDSFSAFVNPVGEGAEMVGAVAGQAYGHHWTPMDQRMEQLFPR